MRRLFSGLPPDDARREFWLALAKWTLSAAALTAFIAAIITATW